MNSKLAFKFSKLAKPMIEPCLKQKNAYIRAK